MISYHPELCANTIRKRIAIQPKIALILGSGLSAIGSQLTDCQEIAYTDIPGFSRTNIVGHSGKLSAGYLNNIPIICCQGRAHYYEGGNSATVIKNMIRSLQILGIEKLIITNAAGSLDQDMPPGSIMMITDHINFHQQNPLIGDNDDNFGPRFVPLDNAYHPELTQHFIAAAEKINLKLYQGTYICVTGPNYETKAEIAAFKTLGANSVGMSTVPEVIVANHCGINTCAISVITNYATGLNHEAHSHEQVVASAQGATKDLENLLKTTLVNFI